ncbi:hypothetical protein SCUP234_07825 [Seiridium cupressi]
MAAPRRKAPQGDNDSSRPAKIAKTDSKSDDGGPSRKWVDDHTPDEAVDDPKPLRLSDTDVSILRDTAVHTQNANCVLTDILAVKNKKMELMALKLERKNHEINQLEEIIKQKTRINREKQSTIKSLDSKLEKLDDEFDEFKHEAAKLIVKAVEQIRLHNEKQQAHMKARDQVQYNKGYDEGGGYPHPDELDAAQDSLKKAVAGDLEALGEVNVRLRELFDYVGINIVVRK